MNETNEKHIMTLNLYRDEAGEFLKRIDPENKESVSKILRMLDEESTLLREIIGRNEALGHQLYDILFLLFELASRYNIDLDYEWLKGWEKKLKYIGD